MAQPELRSPGLFQGYKIFRQALMHDRPQAINKIPKKIFPHPKGRLLQPPSIILTL